MSPLDESKVMFATAALLECAWLAKRKNRAPLFTPPLTHVCASRVRSSAAVQRLLYLHRLHSRVCALGSLPLLSHVRSQLASMIEFDGDTCGQGALAQMNCADLLAQNEIFPDLVWF